MLVRYGEIKWVLREYLRRNGQERIARRPDKQGYPTPIKRWLAAGEGALAKEAAGDSRVQEFCDLRRTQSLVAHHAAGKPGAGNHLYRLVSTELRLRRCIG
jgi:asparagine synthase (glutamine-hydrolysing)